MSRLHLVVGIERFAVAFLPDFPRDEKHEGVEVAALGLQHQPRVYSHQSTREELLLGLRC
jgi:hypothetical protein